MKAYNQLYIRSNKSELGTRDICQLILLTFDKMRCLKGLSLYQFHTSWSPKKSIRYEIDVCKDTIALYDRKYPI